MKKKKTTTRDIAKECGVSQSTVSMILSGRTDIHFSEATIRKVQRTAVKMGYTYKPRPKKEKSQQENTILILCPSLSTDYYTTLVRSITKSAGKKGLYTMTSYTMRRKDTEEVYLQMALDAGFYGVIYTYAPQAIDRINSLRKKLPFVLINDYNEELRIPLIELDSRKSGRMIGEHLYRLGHRHIAYMTTPLDPHELPRIRRMEGLREAFTRNGLPEESVEIVALTNEQWDHYLLGNRYYDVGYQLTLQYLKNEHKATAFVGTNDLISIGVMDALIKSGYAVPEDYSVCGFDNALATSFAGVSLTTIDHSVEEKGDAAVMMLSNTHASVGENDNKKKALMRLEYDPVLLVRNSTGPCK